MELGGCVEAMARAVASSRGLYAAKSGLYFKKKAI